MLYQLIYVIRGVLKVNIGETLSLSVFAFVADAVGMDD